jgi:hypothetical protein
VQYLGKRPEKLDADEIAMKEKSRCASFLFHVGLCAVFSEGTGRATRLDKTRRVAKNTMLSEGPPAFREFGLEADGCAVSLAEADTALGVVASGPFLVISRNVFTSLQRFIP